MSEKIKYDLEFTDRLGNTHRVVKEAEPVEDIEGLQDLIYGFVKLLNISGWQLIEDLEVIENCECECIDEELLEFFCKKKKLMKNYIMK